MAARHFLSTFNFSLHENVSTTESSGWRHTPLNYSDSKDTNVR